MVFFSIFTVLAYLWPVIGRATVVAKKEVFYAFPFGLAAYLWGTLFINRSNRTDALHRLNQESIAIQKDAAKLLMFPEGTRHQGDRLLPFKKGAFHIAIQSGSAIQPVVVSRYWFLDSERKVFGRGKKKHVSLKSPIRQHAYIIHTLLRCKTGQILRKKINLITFYHVLTLQNQVNFRFILAIALACISAPDLLVVAFL